MVFTGFILAGSIIIGVLTVIIAFYAAKYNMIEDSNSLKSRAIAVVLVVFGFILHTLGDYLAFFYGESIEQVLESIAHVIILGGFVFLYRYSEQLLKDSEKYGFR